MGAGVGARVGTGVGARVGARVGTGVGARVGAGVGPSLGPAAPQIPPNSKLASFPKLFSPDPTMAPLYLAEKEVGPLQQERPSPNESRKRKR